MSLDVKLISKTPITKKGTGAFIRENGKTKELTIGEVREKYPNAVIEEKEWETHTVFDANITHNLTDMARAAGIYEACWRPHRLKSNYNIPENDHKAEWAFEDSVETRAKDIIEILERGFEDMKARPEYFKKFDSENGWGTYKDFLPWVESYLKACRENPNAIIKVSR